MTDYDADFARWATDQAALLRAGRLAELDRENLAEELDALARSLHRELSYRLVRLLQNLLQWEYLSFVRLPAWYFAIVEERRAIPRLLFDAPSLRDRWPTTYAIAWKAAREQASYATGMALGVLPREASYSDDQALDVTFWPGDPEKELDRFRTTMRPPVVLAAHRADIRRIVEANRAANPRVFGPFARGEDRPGSDLDLLVDPLPDMSLLDLGGIQFELEALLGVKVDVVTPNGLPDRFRAAVLAEAKPI